LEDSLAVLVVCGLLALMAGIEFGMAGEREPARRALRVLVIERNARLRRDLCAFIRRRGHDATGIATADAAMRLVRYARLDLVLIDQDGLVVARHLRAAVVRVVLMTTGSDPASTAPLRGVAVDDIVAKPLRADRLSAVLEDAAGAARSGRE